MAEFSIIVPAWNAEKTLPLCLRQTVAKERYEVNQRWIWYALERKSEVTLAWCDGRRTDKSCSRLTEKLYGFSAARYYFESGRYSKSA